MSDGCSQHTAVTRGHNLLISPDITQIMQTGACWGVRGGCGRPSLAVAVETSLCSCRPPVASSKLALTWVTPAAAGTTTLNVCRASSGPGSYPDRALEVMWWCWSEAWDGCCSSHRVTPCASRGLCDLPQHASIHQLSTASVQGPPGIRTTRTCCPPGHMTPAGRVLAHRSGRGLRGPAKTYVLLPACFLHSMCLAVTVPLFILARETCSAVTASDKGTISTRKAYVRPRFRSTESAPLHAEEAGQTSRGAQLAWWDGTHHLPTWRAVPRTLGAVLVRGLGVRLIRACMQGRA
jgi:hypothetical protein